MFIIYPMVFLVKLSLGPPQGIRNFSTYFRESFNLSILRTTFVDSAIVAIVCVLFGAVLAWFIHSTPHRIVRALLMGCLFIPFWMGSVLKIYSLTVILEREGLINRVLLDLHIISSPLALLYNQLAVVIGMVYQLLPFAVVPLLVVFGSIDDDLLKAAQSLGATRTRGLATVILPLALPGIIASATITFILGIGFVQTAILLGGAASLFSASTMFNDIFTYYNFGAATVSAIVLLLFAALVFGVVAKLVGGEQLKRVIAR